MVILLDSGSVLIEEPNVHTYSLSDDPFENGHAAVTYILEGKYPGNCNAVRVGGTRSPQCHSPSVLVGILPKLSEGSGNSSTSGTLTNHAPASARAGYDVQAAYERTKQEPHAHGAAD